MTGCMATRLHGDQAGMFLRLPLRLCWDGVQLPRDPGNDLTGRKKKMCENINADDRQPSISDASFQLVIFTIHRERRAMLSKV